jgi:hypothetical protein
VEPKVNQPACPKCGALPFEVCLLNDCKYPEMKKTYGSGLQGLAKRDQVGTKTSDGGSSSVYVIPEDATELNDLIEHKNMPFWLGNIFKACWRYGEKTGTTRTYDLNKIIYFAGRGLGIVNKQS